MWACVNVRVCQSSWYVNRCEKVIGNFSVSNLIDALYEISLHRSGSKIHTNQIYRHYVKRMQNKDLTKYAWRNVCDVKLDYKTSAVAIVFYCGIHTLFKREVYMYTWENDCFMIIRSSLIYIIFIYCMLKYTEKIKKKIANIVTWPAWLYLQLNTF